MIKLAYIYKIINDINNKIYIGKTEFSIEKRFEEHCKDAKRVRCEKRPLYDAINKYGKEHFHIELIEETSCPEERESYWIQFYDTYHKGYNATLGGDGKRRIDYDEVIQLYLKKQNMAEVARILKIHVDSVKKILKVNNIPILSSTEVAKQKAKPILMYSLEDELLQTFNSSCDAARYLIETKQTGSNFTTIRYAITQTAKGIRKTAAGYKWKFKI